MKLILIIVTIFLLGCEKNISPSKADMFMDQVKNESYNDMFLPDLEPVDISVLLTYRNSKQILKKFPVNPISSMLVDSVSLGVIALWTIESIRISELNGDSSEFRRFPSLNPRIIDTTNFIGEKISLQDSVANLYYNWWQNDKLSASDKIKTDPLQGSNFKWH